MRRAVVVGVFLLAACGEKSSPPANEENTAANQSVSMNTVNETSETNAASDNAESGNALGALPPANTSLRFVGSWATSQANCAAKAWRITADTLSAIDGPHCSIYKVTKMPGGYDLAARCPAKKPDELDLIKLRFAESARAMLVESNAIKPTGLIYCGK